MDKLIKITESETGKQAVSAKELYLGLGLNKAVWSRWCQSNIEKNDFFKENIDWVGVQHDVEGNETMDFAITLDFAKHIAMMARTEKSHEYRNYFIKCENAVKEFKQLSPMEQLKLQYETLKDQEEKLNEVNNKVEVLQDNMPLFNIECKELQSLVKKIGTKALGGYRTSAYNNKSLRGRVYADIHHQLRREFGVERYEAIKRSQLEKATEIVTNYKVPTVLVDKIVQANNQISFEETM
jgi:phage anti-repressor protein